MSHQESTRRRVRFGPSIMIVFALLVVPSFLALVGFVFVSNARIAVATADSLMDRFTNEMRSSARELINPGRRLILSASALGSLNPDFLSGDRVSGYLLSLLSQKDSSLSSYVGLQDGGFVQVRRLQPGSRIQDVTVTDPMKFGIRHIEPGASEQWRESYVFLDENGAALARSSDATRYDARSRSWYVQAAAARKMVVSDPYIFSSTGLPGVTIAAPFYRGEALAGVVATDISLETVSRFLLERALGSNSINLIYGDGGTVFASSNAADNYRTVNEKIELNTLSTIASELPAFAVALRAKHPGSRLTFSHPGSGEEYVAIFLELGEEFGNQWTMLSITPMNDFKAAFNRNGQLIVYFGSAAILLQLLLIYVLSRRISRPLERITRSIQNLVSLRDTKRASGERHSWIDEIATLSGAVQRLSSTLSAFTSYIPRDLVTDLLSTGKPIEIGGESRYLTILFTDLKDFSSLSEVTPSRELLIRVSAYLELMTYAIKEEAGTVDKFIGDAVMAFWGAPLLNQHHAYHACVAALKGKKRMASLNAHLASEGKPPLHVRIGIHSDAVLVGNIGSTERLSYTVMGDGVNVAARLEGVNKEYGTQICVSQTLFKEAGERLWMRPIDRITVKGRKGDLIIFELLGTRDGPEETRATEIEKRVCGLTQTAFDLYSQGDFGAAALGYAQLVEQFQDPVAAVMLEKCRSAMVAPRAS